VIVLSKSPSMSNLLKKIDEGLSLDSCLGGNVSMGSGFFENDGFCSKYFDGMMALNMPHEGVFCS